MLRSLALVATLLLVPAAALAGTSKEFKDAGFTWTLPDGWTFASLAPQEEQNGFVAKANDASGRIQVYAYAVATDLDVAGRVQDIQNAGGMGAGDVKATKVLDSTLSGVKGKVVIESIEGQGGAKLHLRHYVIKSGGKLYMLVVRAWHGSHVAGAGAINAARKGFRLLQGAGGEDADEPMTEVGDGGETQAKGPGAVGGWPKTGPKLEGNTAVLERHNVKWTLPDDSPFKWQGAAANYDKFEYGQLVWAGGRVKRDKKEYEKDAPDYNVAHLDLLCLKIDLEKSPGFKVLDWIKGGGAENTVKQWKFFKDIQAGRTRVWNEMAFGNVPGAAVRYEGTAAQGGAGLLLMHATVMQGKLYLARALCRGYNDIWQTMKMDIGRAIQGIEFIDTTRPISGPLLGAFVSWAWDRGEDRGEEKTYKRPGFSFEKPAELNYLKAPQGANMPQLQWAGEARSKDGKAYLYFQVTMVSLVVPRGETMPNEEDILEKRAASWRSGAGSAADMGGAKGALKSRKGRFRGAGGEKYTFTGHLGTTPFVEEGYVVKHKQALYHILFQYGGEDAEKHLKKLIKSVEKGFKFAK